MDLRVKTGLRAPDRKTADGVFAYARGLRDGSLSVADFILTASLEGRIRIVNNGTVTTPITFGAGTIATTAPDFDLIVPSGVLAIPVSIQLYMEAFGSNAQFECMAAAGGGGTAGASNPLTPVSTRVDDSIGNGGITAVGPNTGTTYMTKNVNEFWRDGQQFAITKTTASATASVSDPNKFTWKYSDDMAPPILYDTAGTTRLNIFAKSQAGTGFMIVKYAFLPGTDA